MVVGTLSSGNRRLPPLDTWWSEVNKGCCRHDSDPLGFFSFSCRSILGLSKNGIFDERADELGEEDTTHLADHLRTLGTQFPEILSHSIKSKMSAIYLALEGVSYFYDRVDTAKHSSEIVIARARRALRLPTLLREVAEEIRNGVSLEEGLTLEMWWDIQGSGGDDSTIQRREGYLSLIDHPVQRFVAHLRDCAEKFEKGDDSFFSEDRYPPIKNGVEKILRSCPGL